MPEKHLTTKECVELLDESVRPAIWASLKLYKAKGVLVFSNHAMDSVNCGYSFAIGWGPQNTLTEPPADGKCRVQPPCGDLAWKYCLAAYSDDLDNGVIASTENA